MPPISYWTLLVVFMLPQVFCQKIEPAFKTEGGPFALGNCFGLESIVAYRHSPEGDQLLGNSSDDSVVPPADLQGRVHVKKNDNVVGLRIHQLTFMDSGIYRRECWKDGKQLHNSTLQLHVCAEESTAVEILEGNRGVELQCNVSGLRMDGVFVQWYYEVSETFELQLFLDSRKSLLPLIDKLKGVVKVRDSGATLSFDSSLLKNSSQFYCVVVKEEKCLRFQSMYQLFYDGNMEMFASEGDRVVLPCQLRGSQRHWRTPLGVLNSTNMRTERMFISTDFSLVISAVIDKHGGEYSCSSSSQDVPYSLVLCPASPPKTHVISKETVIKMECDINQNDSQQVRWYLEKPTGVIELIYDSNDQTTAVPDHLRGRVVASASGLTLELWDVQPEDAGVYFCVVLGDQDYPDYEFEDADIDETDESYEEGPYWPENINCILKQKNILTLEPTILDVDTPSTAPDITAVAVGAVVGALAVVALIAAVIVAVKKKQSNQDIL